MEYLVWKEKSSPLLNEQHKLKEMKFADTYLSKPPQVWDRIIYLDKKGLVWMALTAYNFIDII